MVYRNEMSNDDYHAPVIKCYFKKGTCELINWFSDILFSDKPIYRKGIWNWINMYRVMGIQTLDTIIEVQITVLGNLNGYSLSRSKQIVCLLIHGGT